MSLSLCMCGRVRESESECVRARERERERERARHTQGGREARESVHADILTLLRIPMHTASSLQGPIATDRPSDRPCCFFSRLLLLSRYAPLYVISLNVMGKKLPGADWELKRAGHGDLGSQIGACGGPALT